MPFGIDACGDRPMLKGAIDLRLQCCFCFLSDTCIRISRLGSLSRNNSYVDACARLCR